MRTLLSLLVVFLVLGLGSCKKDKDPVNCANWALEVEDELTAAMVAAITFGMDETTENCNAYKEAMEDYINVAEQFVDCEGLTADEREELEDSIEGAQEELDDLNCGDL